VIQHLNGDFKDGKLFLQALLEISASIYTIESLKASHKKLDKKLFMAYYQYIRKKGERQPPARRESRVSLQTTIQTKPISRELEAFPPAVAAFHKRKIRK